ncbi:BLUF domain-containing protein [Rhodosalinus sp. 5P4]|uniref:BLUF domain-containing protein n=1 Tax=Rhodosalinus sp. 5P4 TaxID=3239196 RepID=UPI003524B4A8
MQTSEEVPGDLRRVCYRSRATRPLDAGEIGALVQGAARFNAGHGITGALVSAGVGYQQWLEGPAGVINALMGRLQDDPRHADMNLIENAAIERRAFAGWHMQLFQTPGDLALSPLAVVLGAPLPEAGADWASALAMVTKGLSQRGPGPVVSPAEAESFAQALIAPGEDAIVAQHLAPRLSTATGRAEGYEAVARALGDGWMADRWSMAQVTVALGRFQSLLWQAPQTADPVQPVGHAIVANQPGNPHFLGAVIKADILRASGWSVSLLLDAEPADIEAAARANRTAPVLLSGSRLLSGLVEARMTELGQHLRAALPGTLVLTGGRGGHALSATAQRLWAQVARAKSQGADAFGKVAGSAAGAAMAARHRVH